MCETLCLVCPKCSGARHEHYCEHHEPLRGIYHWFLDVHDDRALGEQHRYDEAAEVFKIAAAGADADAAATATAKLKELAAKTGK